MRGVHLKAYLFSKGETTTDLAKWSLERLGFEVILLLDPNTKFYDKYVLFLEQAVESKDEVVIRADADVIVHKNFNEMVKLFLNQREELPYHSDWWWCGKAFCFLRMEMIDTSPQIISREALIESLANIQRFKDASRPETELTRLASFYTPRRFEVQNQFVAVHGYKQSKEDIARVLQQKKERKQFDKWDHDFINKLKEF